MIIKYWSNGWNYIDNVSKVKETTFHIGNFIQDNKGKLHYDIDFDKIENGDTKYMWDVFFSCALLYIENAINKPIMEYHNRFCTEYEKVRFKKDNSCNVISFYNNSNERYEMVIFSGNGYIMNDSGKTIESL